MRIYYTVESNQSNCVSKMSHESYLGLFSRYHTGSLAFGAAIIAVVQLIRAVLEYVDHKLKGNIR